MSTTGWTFRPDGRGGYRCRLGPEEREVLLDVVDGVIDLLGGARAEGADAEGAGDRGDALDSVRMTAGPVATPHDPAVHRLLPDASADDAEVSAEFRRLTEADLRAAKVAHLQVLRGALERARPAMVVPVAGAQATAAALTDVRLVLSERLGLRTDEDVEALYADAARTGPPAGEAAAARRFLSGVYLALTVLQESLVDQMLHALPEGPD